MALSNSFHNKSHVTAKLNSLTEHKRPFAKTKASASLHNPRSNGDLVGVFLSCLPELEILEQSGPLGLLQ